MIISSLPHLRVCGGGGVLVDHTRIQYMHTHSLHTQYCVNMYMDKYAYKQFMNFNCLAHLKCLYGEWGEGYGGGGGARSRTHKYTCRTVSTGTCISLLIHVDNSS